MSSFLSDLGKTIGGGLGSAVAGPIGGVIGGSLGDSAQDWFTENGADLFSGLGRSLGSDLATGYETRRALGKDRQWDAGRFQRLKRDAEAGDFNAYAALMATGNSNGEQSGNRISTMALRDNSFDQIDAILTGQAAEDRNRQKVRDELERIELDERRRGQIQTNTSSTGNKVGPVTNNFFGMSGERLSGSETIDENDVSINPEHDGDARATISDPERDMPLTIVVSTPGGYSYRIPNPELFESGLSEMMGGAIMHGGGIALEAANHARNYLGEKMDEATKPPPATRKDFLKIIDSLEKQYPNATQPEIQAMLDQITGSTQ